MINLSLYQRKTRQLHQRVLEVLEPIDSSAYFAVKDAYDSDEPKLQLALIGQYNAGKSTIIKALTDNQDIKIDSNVCTDDVTAYDWNNIRILDTPGIHAGREDHDKTTYSAIDKADLLIFAITNELFDDVIGKHFRQLAFEHQKAKEMLLVVNKMARDSGTPDIKIPSLLPVLEPSLPEDFQTTFIDAECYLEAQEEDDPEDRAELLEESHFDELVTAINRFVTSKGIMGKLTTPLSTMQTVVRKLQTEKSVSDPNEQILVELLHRKQAILREAGLRLKRTMQEMLRRTTYEVAGEGDRVAESLSETSSEEKVKENIETAKKNCESALAKLNENYADAVKQHVEQLEFELKQLEESQLAQSLNSAIERIASLSAADIDQLGSDVTINSYDTGSKERYGKLAGWAHKGLNFTFKSAQGAKATAGNIGSATAASGSQIHQGVKFVGKMIGYKFKPWQAVNIAKNIGNFARYAGPVLSLIGIGFQIYDDIKQEECRQSLHKARADVRRDFLKISRDLDQDFQQQILQVCEDIHSDTLSQTQSVLDEMTAGAIQKNSQLEQLHQLDRDISGLIGEIQQAA
ncbi:50S ribosome-binding GTPase [Endozoicomonas gorgoniicola]|uniref:50S ribosome-binding GTPase n=1 Tax=Endozoicomonas gorgoniicola TaxID=1234144 RepID=A0ABT3N0D6_9GAMM|nr:GTPase [Endozoicomonas gorgoniicola]MCW7555095.1 50S ribosome-binding GTPase [Endozoicomonas gorgoniicola]